jgi:hypothetical protein
MLLMSDVLKGEYVIISNHLADLPSFMAIFAYNKRQMPEGEILAPSISSLLPLGGDLF